MLLNMVTSVDRDGWEVKRQTAVAAEAQGRGLTRGLHCTGISTEKRPPWMNESGRFMYTENDSAIMRCSVFPHARTVQMPRIVFSHCPQGCKHVNEMQRELSRAGRPGQVLVTTRQSEQPCRIKFHRAGKQHV